MTRIFILLLLKLFTSVTSDVVVQKATNMTSKEFFDKYVSQYKPVVIPSFLKEMTRPSGVELKIHGLSNSALGILSVHVVNGSAASLSTLLTNPDLPSIRVPIHHNLKSRLHIPSILQCKPFVDKFLLDTIHFYVRRAEATDKIDISAAHSLACLVEGSVDFTIRISGFDSTVSLTPDDCIFIPKLSDPKELGVGHWIVIRWTEIESQSYCEKELQSRLTFADVAWPGEGITKAKEKTTDRHRAAMDTLIYVVEKFIAHQEIPLSFEDFRRKLEHDKVLLPELPHWNEECSDVAKELFTHLDRNKDLQLNLHDLEDIQSENMELYAGIVQDRSHDWGDIIYDMRVDLAGPLPPNPRLPEAEDFIERLEKHNDEKMAAKLAAKKSKARAKDEL